MFNFLYTDILSAYDLDMITQKQTLLSENAIQSKIVAESTQKGMPDMYSNSGHASPHDYDDSAYGRSYTLMVKKRDKDKAKKILDNR